MGFLALDQISKRYNIIMYLIIIISIFSSSLLWSQAKGKEYGVLQKGKAVEISHRRNSDNSIDFLYRKTKVGAGNK